MYAERLAEQILQADPNNADAHFLLFAARGRRLMREDGRPSFTNFWKYARVNEHLSRALELNPSHAHALAARGGILIDLPEALGGNPAEGRTLLEKALRLNPTGVGTRLTLARALIEQGERTPAREQLLLAAHYACLKREVAPLKQVEELLGKIDASTL